jgi:hypothetical protein
VDRFGRDGDAQPWLLPWAGLLPAMMGQPFAHGEALHNVSIQRLAFLLGLKIAVLLTFVPVALPTVLALYATRALRRSDASTT